MNKKYMDQIFNLAMDIEIDATVLREAAKLKDIKALRRLSLHLAENIDKLQTELRNAAIEDRVKTILTLPPREAFAKLREVIAHDHTIMFNPEVNKWCRDNFNLIRELLEGKNEKSA